MNKKSKKLLLFKLFLISTLCIVLNSYNVSFAQGESPEEITKEKKSAAYKALGRELTRIEKDLYGDLDPKGVFNAVGHLEGRLILVRALIAVGEAEHVSRILEIMPNELKPFTDWVEYLKGLKEKHGLVLDGVYAELVLNLKDDEKAFTNAASIAYEAVFGIAKERQKIEQIVNFLKSKEATTYSKMLLALVSTMTQEDKKELLFRTLEELGLEHLKENKKFIDKILSQKVITYKTLKKLLEQVSDSNVKGKKKK